MWMFSMMTEYDFPLLWMKSYFLSGDFRDAESLNNTIVTHLILFIIIIMISLYLQKKKLGNDISIEMVPHHTWRKNVGIAHPYLSSPELEGGNKQSSRLFNNEDSVTQGQFPVTNTEYKCSFCLFTQKLHRAPLKAKCTNSNLVKDPHLTKCSIEGNLFLFN